MPFTVNGIGTHYYGKKNLHVRTGVCQHCHREVELRTYETRLWIVVLFIPVVPLGRKQVIDYCPRCTHHRSMPLAEWHRRKEEAIFEAVAKMTQEPEDPKSALELHRKLAAFRQAPEAAQVADVIKERFPDNAEVQVHLGSWYASEGHLDEANSCFERALHLESGNEEAKRGVAIGRIRAGDLASARELLSFMERPGPDQDPSALMYLGQAYQKEGDHEEALAVFGAALEGSPELARDKQFRRTVRMSEKATGRPTSMLPRLPLWRSRPALVGGLAAVVLLVLVIVNYYLATHQTLYIVNRLGTGVTVTVDGGDAVSPGLRPARVPLAEGSHTAVISGTPRGEEKADFEIVNTVAQRFSGGNVFVLNVGAAADLLWEEVVYGAAADSYAEPKYRIHFGENFMAFHNIDFAFREFPETITTEHERTTKTRLSVIAKQPVTVFAHFPEGTPPERFLAFAEHHLSVTPGDEALVQTYAMLCGGFARLDRCRKFLEQGLSQRPVLVEWHRMYQEVCRGAGEEGALVLEYDHMLGQEPENSALLYLRGRIEPRTATAMTYYDRAIAADASNPYPWFAKGYHLASNAQFAPAREATAEACRLKPGHSNMEELLFDVRFALGEYEALEQEIAGELEELPLNTALQRRLLMVRVARGDLAGARQAHADYAAKVRSRNLEGQVPWASESRLMLLYLEGNFQELLEGAGTLKDQRTLLMMQCQVHLELGELEDAENALRSVSIPGAPYESLLLSLAWDQHGRQDKAQEWWEEATRRFAATNYQNRQIARLLSGGEDLSLDDVADLCVYPTAKASIVVALAGRCPANRAELLALAERLNFSLYFPHHFLARTIAAMKE